MNGREWADRALSLLFPKRCVLCGGVVEYDQLTCEGCEPPRPREEDCCPACGHEAGACTCREGFAWGFDAAAHPLLYRDGVRGAILALKETPDRRVAAYLAGEMFRLLDLRYPDDLFDAIIPVPMSAEKRRRRGFNQAELLGAALHGLCGVPMRRELLLRTEDSLVQHELGRQDRFENALRSYRLGDGLASLKHTAILLVDDLFTTGATAHACALRLKQGGAVRVCVLTAAGAGGNSD